MAQRLPEGPLGRFLEPSDRPPRRSALTLRFEDESMTDDRMKAMDEDERQAVFTILDAAPNLTQADKSFVKASLWTQGEVSPVTSDEQARAYERKADEIQAAAGVPDGSSPDFTRAYTAFARTREGILATSLRARVIEWEDDEDEA